MITVYGVPLRLKIGIPYTYGNGSNWYVLLSGGPVLYLNSSEGFEALDPVDAVWHHREAVIQEGFRYAQSMEIL